MPAERDGSEVIATTTTSTASSTTTSTAGAEEIAMTTVSGIKRAMRIKLHVHAQALMLSLNKESLPLRCRAASAAASAQRGAAARRGECHFSTVAVIRVAKPTLLASLTAISGIGVKQHEQGLRVDYSSAMRAEINTAGRVTIRTPSEASSVIGAAATGGGSFYFNITYDLILH